MLDINLYIEYGRIAQFIVSDYVLEKAFFGNSYYNPEQAKHIFCATLALIHANAVINDNTNIISGGDIVYEEIAPAQPSGINYEYYVQFANIVEGSKISISLYFTKDQAGTQEVTGTISSVCLEGQTLVDMLNDLWTQAFDLGALNVILYNDHASIGIFGWWMDAHAEVSMTLIPAASQADAMLQSLAQYQYSLYSGFIGQIQDVINALMPKPLEALLINDDPLYLDTGFTQPLLYR